MIATDQTEPELVLIDDSEKKNFHIEEIEPNLEDEATDNLVKSSEDSEKKNQ